MASCIQVSSLAISCETSSKKIMRNLKTNWICQLIPWDSFLRLWSEFPKLLVELPRHDDSSKKVTESRVLPANARLITLLSRTSSYSALCWFSLVHFLFGHPTFRQTDVKWFCQDLLCSWELLPAWEELVLWFLLVFAVSPHWCQVRRNAPFVFWPNRDFNLGSHIQMAIGAQKSTLVNEMGQRSP